MKVFSSAFAFLIFTATWASTYSSLYANDRDIQEPRSFQAAREAAIDGDLKSFFFYLSSVNPQDLNRWYANYNVIVDNLMESFEGKDLPPSVEDQQKIELLKNHRFLVAIVNEDMPLIRSSLQDDLIDDDMYAHICDNIKDPVNREYLAMATIEVQDLDFLEIFVDSAKIENFTLERILEYLCSIPDENFDMKIAKLIKKIIVENDCLLGLRAANYGCLRRLSRTKFNIIFSELSLLMEDIVDEEKDIIALGDIYDVYFDPLRKILTPHLETDEINQKYHFLKLIGKGGNGSVYRAFGGDDRRMKAIKCVKLDPRADVSLLADEVMTHGSIPPHENILELEKVYLHGHALYMVLPLITGGSLFRTLNPSTRSVENKFRFCPFTEREVALIAYQILNGIAHLHENLILHLDIKLDNVLWDMNGTLKIADFGHSVKLDHVAQKLNGGGWSGTAYWRPPEHVEGRNYGSAFDIWSFGISVIELLRGGTPPHIRKHSPKELMGHMLVKQAPKLSYLSSFSGHLQNFVRSCLTIDDSERPTAQDLLKHPFVDRKWTREDKQKLAAKLTRFKTSKSDK